MVTPDKDYQLVSNNIFVQACAMGNDIAFLALLDLRTLRSERPEQLIDTLGMWGDAVDNIPGIPGVGEKTAMKLCRPTA